MSHVLQTGMQKSCTRCSSAETLEKSEHGVRDRSREGLEAKHGTFTYCFLISSCAAARKWAHCEETGRAQEQVRGWKQAKKHESKD